MPLMSCPVWQNGIPQSMQRAPCCCSFDSEKCSWNSFQSFTRSNGERSSGSSRSNSMNPVGLPISYTSLSLSSLIKHYALGFDRRLVAAHSRRVILVRLERRHQCVVANQPFGFGVLQRFEHTAVIL